MKTFLFISACACLLFFSACLTMMARMTGYVKKPKLEDSLSILKYSAEHHDPYDKLWVASSMENYDTIFNRFKGVPTVLIYDKDFNVLENARGERCQYMLAAFFDDSTTNKYVLANDSSYQFLAARIKEIASYPPPKCYDYTVVYIWVKWTPTFNERIFSVMKNIKRNSKKKALFISLNRDYTKDMFKDTPKFKLGKTTAVGRANTPMR